MEQNYSNLKGKTVFDFTDKNTAEKYALCTENEHKKHLSTNKWRVAFTLIKYATLTSNNKLLEAVVKQYKDIISSTLNE